MFRLFGITETGELEYLNTYMDLVTLQIEAYRVFTNKMFKIYDQHGKFIEDLA